MAENVAITFNRGCDYLIRMRLALPVDVSSMGAAVEDWNLVFEVRTTRGGSPVLTANGALSSIPRAAELGIFDFPVTANNTAALAARSYFYAIRRVDAGYIDVLTKGDLNVETF